uniref:V-type proton ATPase subunit a n=1 Tax=Acrobeloides nanus TaxID=290746 RepID=A0A914CMB5_9BILA
MQIEGNDNELEYQVSYSRTIDTAVIQHVGSNLISESDGQPKPRLNFVNGVIKRERLPVFERVLWRACYGKVFLRQAEILESIAEVATESCENKSVFIIFFQERRDMSIGVMNRIEDLKTVLGQTHEHRHRILTAAAQNVQMWMTKVRKIKAIYHVLNCFNLDQQCLIAECWCPVSELDQIKLALKRGSEISGSTVQSILNRMVTNETPPTYFKTNKFTQGFQNIVDSYGIAAYREINPAALLLVFFEKRLEATRIKDEIFQMFFYGRYVILLMGCFSVYTGLIYNEAFSKSMNIFGSSWRNSYSIQKISDFIHFYGPDYSPMLIPEKAYIGEPYFIGVDPIWNLAEVNKLNFLNSMKMKAAILVGIAQMIFGIILGYRNFKYFNSKLDVLYTFIPQIIFLGCIFIYLCIEIIMKWVIYDAKGGYYALGYWYPSANCAPSLLIGLINMLMPKSRDYGFVKDNKPCNTTIPSGLSGGCTTLKNCHLNYWYPNQHLVETTLIVIACVSVPVMLFAKPFFLYRLYRRNALSQYRDINAHDPISDSVYADNEHGHDHKQIDIADMMVKQAIHTIEFVLGCVSHTASYLRLWALSLAHAQLSDVLWTKVFRRSLESDGCFGAVSMYIIFFYFAFFSLAILVVMEGLSAFLHALRLHW